jgi:hypothetical protein
MITYEEDVDNENINISNHSEPDAILNIKSNLLQPPERLKVGNRLIEDCKLSSEKMNFLVFITNKVFYINIE